MEWDRQGHHRPRGLQQADDEGEPRPGGQRLHARGDERDGRERQRRRARFHDPQLDLRGPIRIQATKANILLDRNRHDWNAVYHGEDNAKIFVSNPTGAISGVTVRNSSIRNGNLDGVHLGGAGVNLLRQRLRQPLRHRHQPHRQRPVRGGHRRPSRRQLRPRRRRLRHPRHHQLRRRHQRRHDRRQRRRHPPPLRHRALRRPQQRRASQHHPLVRRRRLPLHRPHLRADRHQPQEPGPRGLGHAGLRQPDHRRGLQQRLDRTAHHNASGRRARYVGPLHTYAGFRLARKSPVGRRRASDGLDVGARIHAPRSRAGTAARASARGSMRRWGGRSSTIWGGRAARERALRHRPRDPRHLLGLRAVAVRRAPVSIVTVFNDAEVRHACLDRRSRRISAEAPSTEYLPVDNVGGAFASAGAALNPARPRRGMTTSPSCTRTCICTP